MFLPMEKLPALLLGPLCILIGIYGIEDGATLTEWIKFNYSSIFITLGGIVITISGIMKFAKAYKEDFPNIPQLPFKFTTAGFILHHIEYRWKDLSEIYAKIDQSNNRSHILFRFELNHDDHHKTFSVSLPRHSTQFFQFESCLALSKNWRQQLDASANKDEELCIYLRDHPRQE